MAVAWLDIARFADTNGYQNDFVRSMWVWRDWVIDAYNQNMPYDQFIIEQIAGDMLPDATDSQLIASGFHRNNPSVTEGGSIEEEWRVENCVDRTETTAAAFLGLTIGCARCHDHKYDPVSQREFYEFFAFFNNIDEKGVYTERRGNAPPLLKTPTPDQVAALAAVDEKIAALERKIQAQNQGEDARSKAEAILKEWRSAITAATVPQHVWSAGDTSGDGSDWSPAGRALSLNGQGVDLAHTDKLNLDFERDTPFTWTCWVHGQARGAIFGKLDESKDFRGVDTLILNDGRLKIHLISKWDTNAIAVLSKDALPEGWSHVAATYAGDSQAAGFKIYVNGKAIEPSTERDSLSGTTIADVPFRIGQRSQSSYLRGKIAQFRLYSTVLSEEQVAWSMKQDVVAHVDQVTQSDPGSSAVDSAYAFLTQSNEHAAERAKLIAHRKKLIASQQTTMIMRERKGDYRPTWELRRGQYDQPNKELDLWPGIPKALPQLAEDQPKNRLGLARWLVDDRNPLVARVIVNRAWLKFFGRGLVDPPDNFGVQGDPPSHPKLLDWLADDFRTHGWDLKRLHRQIVLSATYQQASEWTSKKLEIDRENRWLSRGPRYRLSAEQIRDSALFVSGLLERKLGGPSVFPYQPAGLWDELAGGANNGPYKQSSGPDLYRRSLYTYRKRTVPHPTTSTFDAPSWEKCQIKRANTNTPLQALALLNDATYVEAARKFAERILSEGGKTLDERIDFALLAVAARPATDVERVTLKRGFQYYKEYYSENPEQANELLSTGDSTVEAGIDNAASAELASMTSVASVILNLDKTMTKE